MRSVSFLLTFDKDSVLSQLCDTGQATQPNPLFYCFIKQDNDNHCSDLLNELVRPLIPFSIYISLSSLSCKILYESQKFVTFSTSQAFIKVKWETSDNKRIIAYEFHFTTGMKELCGCNRERKCHYVSTSSYK